MDPKVSNGHVPKEKEKQVLSDLSSFPLLAGMLSFEKELKQNKCRNRGTYEQKYPETNNAPVPLIVSCSTNHKVSSRHVSKEEACRVLSDLTDFPGLAAMLSFEKAQKENKNRQKIESEQQNSTSCSINHKVSSCHVSEEEARQVLSDLTDFPDHATMLSFEKAWKENKKRQTTESEPQNSTSCSTNHKVRRCHVSKEDACQVLSDLTDFPDLAAMLSFEKAWKENKKRQKTESQLQNSMSYSTNHKVSSCHVSKEEARQVLSDLTDLPGLAAVLSSETESEPQSSTCCSVDHKVSSTHVSKKEERQVLSDLTDFPCLAAMVSVEQALKENRKRQKTLSKVQSSAVSSGGARNLDEVNDVEENKRGDLSTERVPSQPGDIVNDVEEDKRDDSSTERVPSQPGDIVKDVEEDKRGDLSTERVPSQPVDIVNDVEEDKQEDSITERVPSQPVDIVKDVEEDRREDSNIIRVNVPEEEHREDSSNDEAEPIEEDRPKNLGTSSVPFEAKPLEINFPQLNQPSSELHAELVETRDNVVHRKYPRGGRYFDDPTSKSVMADEFLSLNKRKGKKKCLLCGDCNHKAKDCKQVVDCFVCYSRGHLESDCPKKHIDKDENRTLCLKCGDVGHDMFSCSNKYFPDDLKQVQCSVCMAFGHLSCVDYMVEDRKQVSCYKCGELGHAGSDCKKLLESFSTTMTRLFCYRCRQRGHYSRECAKRNKAPDADSASESIIPNLALIQSNSILPRSNLQPCNSFSLEERVGETSAQ